MIRAKTIVGSDPPRCVFVEVETAPIEINKVQAISVTSLLPPTLRFGGAREGGTRERVMIVSEPGARRVEGFEPEGFTTINGGW